MSVYRGSASGGRKVTPDTCSEVLISGVNWLGDAVMSAPAVQAFKRGNHTVRVAMLVKPALAPLWRLHPDIDSVIELQEDPAGTFRTARTVRAGRFQKAFVLPHSFRSTLIPFLAGVPERVGMPGHCRDWMLTRVVKPRMDEGREHQVFEYLDLMGLTDAGSPESPCFHIPEELAAQCRDRLSRRLPGYGRRPLVGMFPGAAFGPAKWWPAPRFAEVARVLREKKDCGVVLFGSARERRVVSEAADGAGEGVLNLSGETSLPELAAMLSLCDVVVGNDSGGMHLAAAVGARVVAIFGATDPARTGPLGSGHRLLVAEEVEHSRDIRRDSERARKALLSIRAGAVYHAVADLLEQPRVRKEEGS